MTSPDGAGLPSGPEKIGQWNPLVALGKLGEQLIMQPLSHLLAWILGDEPEDWDTFEELAGNLIPALIRLPVRVIVQLIGGIPVIGDGVEAAFANWLKNTNETATDAAETVVSVGTQVNYVQQIIALRSGRPVWETGPDRTGEVSFPWCLMNLNPATIELGGGAHSVSISGQTGFTSAGGDNHRHSGTSLDGSAPNHPHTVMMNPPVVNATASYAPWGNIIFGTAAERKVFGWVAYKTGVVNTFHLDVYKLEADGSATFTGYSSPNLAGELSSTMLSWMQHLMNAGSITADIGDMYDVQFRMTGPGTVHIAGVNFYNPTRLPGFRPYTSGSGRNPASNPTPATISTVDRDAMYTGPTPFVSIGIDVGQVDIGRFFFDDFNDRSAFGPRWITYGPIRIRNGRFEHNESGLAITSGAAMYHQPLASDADAVGFDHWPETGSDPRFRATGVGMHCSSGLGSGVWLSADGRGVYLETGGYTYGSRTLRAQHAPVGGGRLLVEFDPADSTYRVYHGSTDTEPLFAWPDPGGIVQRGIGRRWWSLLVTGGFLAPSTKGDNVTAADIATEEEP
ncbi:minor tail protein [Gordonia phage Jojo24]|uniref:Minor tail protein n=1 Tax=Gordonia phage Jojo24 TaxID=2859476 RepID=A0AAE7SSL7_9CAUD|nr:minor tail protein [Gordonia phage Jojo24]QXO13122.1 minor tail protein [Gordonia phage Jojo24]